MRLLLLYSTFLVCQQTWSQPVETDSLVRSTCDCVTQIKWDESNKIEFELAFNDCIELLYGVFASQGSANQSEKMASQCISILSSSCSAFNNCVKIFNQSIRHRADSRITDSTLCQIFKQGKFEDISQEKDVIIMEDTMQTILFPTLGYYSWYKVIWIGECSYMLQLIESTNPFTNSKMSLGEYRSFRIVDIREKDEIIIEAYFQESWRIGHIRKVKL